MEREGKESVTPGRRLDDSPCVLGCFRIVPCRTSVCTARESKRIANFPVLRSRSNGSKLIRCDQFNQKITTGMAINRKRIGKKRNQIVHWNDPLVRNRRKCQKRGRLLLKCVSKTLYSCGDAAHLPLDPFVTPKPTLRQIDSGRCKTVENQALVKLAFIPLK